MRGRGKEHDGCSITVSRRGLTVGIRHPGGGGRGHGAVGLLQAPERPLTTLAFFVNKLLDNHDITC